MGHDGFAGVATQSSLNIARPLQMIRTKASPLQQHSDTGSAQEKCTVLWSGTQGGWALAVLDAPRIPGLFCLQTEGEMIPAHLRAGASCAEHRTPAPHQHERGKNPVLPLRSVNLKQQAVSQGTLQNFRHQRPGCHLFAFVIHKCLK
jgi:hypothetical protein